MATMRQKYGSLSGSFSEQLQQFADQTKDKMDVIFQDIVIEIGRSVINLTPVDTGRAKANWQFSIETPSNMSLDSYDKVGHETIAKLVSEVQALEIGQKAWIVSNLVYVKSLEYGHSQQAPAGMIRITLARFQQIVAEAVRANA